MEKLLSLEVLELLLTLVAAFAASSGFWAYITKQTNDKSLERRLLIGLAHDRIVFLAMSYIERGFITQDEYENLYEFLYKPYIEMGGNGSAKRLMDEVNKLPINNKVITVINKTKELRSNNE